SLPTELEVQQPERARWIPAVGQGLIDPLYQPVGLRDRVPLQVDDSGVRSCPSDCLRPDQPGLMNRWKAVVLGEQDAPGLRGHQKLQRIRRVDQAQLGSSGYLVP